MNFTTLYLENPSQHFWGIYEDCPVPSPPPTSNFKHFKFNFNRNAIKTVKFVLNSKLGAQFTKFSGGTFSFL